MGKLLDAVRHKSKAPLSGEQEAFVTAVESAYTEILTGEMKAGEERSSAALTEALNRVVGVLPRGKDGEQVTVVGQIREIAAKMDRIESMQTRSLGATEKLRLRKMLNDNKDRILEAVRSGNSPSVEISFSAVRAAATMTTSNVVTGAATTTGVPLEWDDEIAFIRFPKNIVMDVIRSSQADRVPPNIVKREQKATEGSAAVTAEGAVKQLVSYSFEDKIYTRKKIAAHIEWTEELERDFDSLFNEIVNLFETDVIRQWNQYVLSLMVSSAPVYVSTPLDETIPVPNIYSVIGAGILQIQSLNYEPDTIFMNPADVWAMNLSQDTTGQVIVPPIMVGSNQIAGLALHTSNSITAGKILIGQASTWKESHTGCIVRIGMINDQFIRNEKSIVGEIYTLPYLASRDKAAWIYLDIATVEEALAVPPPEE
jgi:HK97 family phage major capsid protein